MILPARSLRAHSFRRANSFGLVDVQHTTEDKSHSHAFFCTSTLHGQLTSIFSFPLLTTNTLLKSFRRQISTTERPTLSRECCLRRSPTRICRLKAVPSRTRRKKEKLHQRSRLVDHRSRKILSQLQPLFLRKELPLHPGMESTRTMM